ncbi:MAG: DUF1080 domain-containing protein [Planctomycetaceae bacterium]|jgi:hypothetical protein|nr:DUF1080 domain-containing protein [Planctomycetaceae bacterium]
MKNMILLCLVPILFSWNIISAQNSKPAEYTSVAEISRDEVVNRDFLIQGEYFSEDNGTVFSVNLVAEGNGQFRVVVFPGGFPGDGWNRGDERILGKAVLNDSGDLIATLNEIPDPLTVKIDKTKAILSTVFEDQTYSFNRIQRQSPTQGQSAPEGAVVLFADGKASELFERAAVNKEAKTLWAEARTKPFEKRPYLLHIEFMLSYMPFAKGQGRSNSGVYIDERYECQILDSFGLDGKNNECGGFYQQAEPKVNMCFPPLQWQTYDIDYTPAVFGADGKKTVNAIITVKHNGIVIHDAVKLAKETPGCKKEGVEANGLYLQGHGNKVQFRNIWLKYQ